MELSGGARVCEAGMRAAVNSVDLNDDVRTVLDGNYYKNNTFVRCLH